MESPGIRGKAGALRYLGERVAPQELPRRRPQGSGLLSGIGLALLGCVVVMVVGMDGRLRNDASSLSGWQARYIVCPAIGGIRLLYTMPVVGKSGADSAE